MTISSKAFASLLGLLNIAVCACSDTRQPSDTQPSSPPAEASPPELPMTVEGTFAFANEAGSELLSLALSETPTVYSSAVCGEATSSVRYVRTQFGNANSSHRQVASNFANEPGDVYEVQGAAVPPDATCLVTTDGLLPHVATVERSLEASPCSDAQAARLEGIAGRSAVDCWRLAALEGGVEFVAAQFANVDTMALAAVALVQDSVVLFQGLPGRYSAPGESIWRVDDGGVLDPSAIRLLLAAQSPNEWAVAFAWAGAEGESLRLVVADSVVEARNLLEAYRYWSPQ